MTGRNQTQPPISDYGLIGDSRACALVSSAGSVDWLCLPRPDSEPVFGRLLSWTDGGYFQIEPVGSYTTQRRYVPSTNVLETTFTTSQGTVTLTDFMPALSEETKARALHPLRSVVRIIECHLGRVAMRLSFHPVSGFDKRPVQLQSRGPRTVAAGGRHGLLLLRGSADLSVEGNTAVADFEVSRGTSLTFCLTYSEDDPVVLLNEAFSLRLRSETVNFWQEWSRSLTYRGEWPEAVLRSALTLKLLSYAPTGAVLAAPTTSIPEEIGGERNWDYRFCWPRDAALSVKALSSLGFEDEAIAFFAWLLNTTRLKPIRLQPLYTLFGEANIKERKLANWTGYQNSRPVRVGNAAAHQTQLDVYGELLDAAHAFLSQLESTHRVSRDEARFLTTLVNRVVASWRQPDSGIWEPRVAPRHYTHSKVMAWVALDRAIDLAKRGLISGPIGLWQREADEIRALLISEGYSDEQRAFTLTLGGRTLDAALLAIPLVGFLPAGDERVRATVDTIRADLDQDGFLKRHRDFDDGLEGEEGAFLICNFWLAAALARIGELEDAQNVFERTLRSANDLLLFSEEYDCAAGLMLGNFPQAFSHLGLIMAALEISAAEGRSA